MNWRTASRLQNKDCKKKISKYLTPEILPFREDNDCLLPVTSKGGTLPEVISMEDDFKVLREVFCCCHFKFLGLYLQVLIFYVLALKTIHFKNYFPVPSTVA